MRFPILAAFVVVANVFSLVACGGSSSTAAGDKGDDTATYSRAYSTAASSTTSEALGVASWSVEIVEAGMAVEGQDASGKKVLTWKIQDAGEHQVYELRGGGGSAKFAFDHAAQTMAIEENTFSDPKELQQAITLLHNDLKVREAVAKTSSGLSIQSGDRLTTEPGDRLTGNPCRLVEDGESCASELEDLAHAWDNESFECLECWGYNPNGIYPPWCGDCVVANDQKRGKMSAFNKCKDDDRAAREACKP